jgi:phosphoribosylformylglycinamidine synthase
VAVRPGNEKWVLALCEQAGVPVAPLGVVGGDSLIVSAATEGRPLFSISLAELRESHEATLPRYVS